MERQASLIEASYKAGDTAFEVISDLIVRPEINVPLAAEVHLQAFVQIGDLLEPKRQCLEVVVELAEDLVVGQEGDDRAGLSLLEHVQRL